MVVNQLFGQITGLGMSVVTFDWAQVVYANQSPLLVPFWAGANVMGSFALFFWLLCPLIYYTTPGTRPIYRCSTRMPSIIRPTLTTPVVS